MKRASPTVAAPVQKQVFDRFAEEMRIAGISDEVIERLDKALRANTITDTVLRKAVFSDDPKL